MIAERLPEVMNVPDTSGSVYVLFAVKSELVSVPLKRATDPLDVIERTI